MTRILDRYIFREIATTWLGVTMVLLLILLTNQFARVLGDVAKGKLPKDAAFDVIGLSAVQYLTILLPIGLFLAIMLALGRMYRDSELPAMMACRVGPAGIYRPLAWLMLPIVLFVAGLAIEGGPWAYRMVDRIGAEARRQADLTSIEPGQFTTIGPDRAVVYGDSVTPEGNMENVFMQRQADDGSVEVVVADIGVMIESEDPNTRLLVLRSGRRYEGVPGTTEFRVIEFAEHGIPYRLPSLSTPEPKPREMPFFDLMRSDGPEYVAEFQWRLGVPISTIILAILAVPLSKSQPRSGRYARLAIGLLVFIIYLNMISVATAWIEQSRISPALGIWWVHASMLMFTLGLLAVQNGYPKRLFR